ncbi:MAG: hypothetical protein WCO09_03395 [bacterium]
MKATATLNLKEVPATLRVNGTIMTYSENDKVEIKKAVPQGINPTILLLDLKIIEKSGPMKGTDKPFQYESSEKGVEKFKQVTILQETKVLITVNVEVMG